MWYTSRIVTCKSGSLWNSYSATFVTYRVTKESALLILYSKRRKPNIIGHILRRNCFLIHVTAGNIEGKIEVMEGQEEDVSSYWIILSRRSDSGNWRGRTRSYFVENLLWQRLWTGSKTGYGMNDDESFGRGYGPVARPATEWMMMSHLAEAMDR